MTFIRKGDQVKILNGKDRGSSGKVIHVFLKSQKATVEGRNVYTRHERPKKSGEKGQKIQFPRPLEISNLMLICPHCKKPTRVGHQTDEQGIKTRLCKKCKKRIA